MQFRNGRRWFLYFTLCKNTYGETIQTSPNQDVYVHSRNNFWLLTPTDLSHRISKQ